MKGFKRTKRLKCPVCGALTGEIPCNMGNKVVKCTCCGRFIEYKFRTNTVETTSEPYREKSSGSIFY